MYVSAVLLIARPAKGPAIGGLFACSRAQSTPIPTANALGTCLAPAQIPFQHSEPKAKAEALTLAGEFRTMK